MSTQDYGSTAGKAGNPVNAGHPENAGHPVNPVEFPEKQGPAVGTIVWGAVVMAIGALILADRLGWLNVEPGYAAAGVMLLAGLGLVVGGLLAAGRRRRAAADGGVPEGGARGRGGGAAAPGSTSSVTE